MRGSKTRAEKVSGAPLRQHELDGAIESLEAVLLELDDLDQKEAAIHVCHAIDVLAAERAERER